MTRRFEVVEELNRHGRAVLFKARDHANGGVNVTVRRYLGSSAECEALGAALAELASLQHPNLERVVEVGEDDEGLFAVVDAPWGESLSDMLKGGPLTVAEFDQVASQLLAAACALHELGYPHLALRPEIVRVSSSPPGSALHLRLTGYGEGFGRAAGESPADMSAYRCCAPEHWRGEPVGRRTDVYALGCIFYEALSGRPAFRGSDAEAMRDAHLDHDVAPLESAAPHAPRWMTAWVMHLVEPAPETRVKNAVQARDLFLQRENGLTITATTTNPPPGRLPQPPAFMPGPPVPLASYAAMPAPPPAAQPVPAIHPVTANVPSARATSTAIPVMVQGTGAFRHRAAPLRSAAKSSPPPAAPPKGKPPRDDARMMASILIAAACAIAIGVYFVITRGSGNGSNAPLSPITAGLVLHLDADLPETIFREPATGRIRRWKNAAGKPPHLQQTDRNAMPAVIGKGLGDRSVMDFGPITNGAWMPFMDDAGKRLEVKNVRTVFWVLKGANFLLTDDNTNHFHRGNPEGSPTAAIFRDAEAAVMKVRLDGREVDAAATPLPDGFSIVSAVAAQPLEAGQLCKDRSQPNRRGGQQIAEILVYDRAMSADEIKRMEGYLRRKWFGQ